MNIGTGIAIAGVWLGVGVVAIGAGEVAALMAVPAMIATGAIAVFSN